MRSKSGRVVVRLRELMDKYARRDDGTQSALLADHRFDNHNKMTISGIVQAGSDAPDVNPVEDADRIMPRCQHYPVGYIGGGIFEVDIRPGDRVWFHYLCAEDRTSIERNHDGSWDVYMQVSDIFCIEREGILIMNQNWIMGDTIPQPTLSLVDQHGYEKAAELSPGSGIYISHGASLDAYVDEAITRHLDPCCYRGVHNEVKAGDRVYLAKNAMFPNVIRDRVSQLFRHTDVLALYNADVALVKPVGENHLVKVDEKEYKSTVIHHTVVIKAPEWGTIIASGAQCRYGKVGDKIMFTRRFTRLLSKEYWLVNDSEIQATLQ